MGVSGNCMGYMLREELSREKMVTRQRRRARSFEEKLERGGGSKIAQVCWELIKKGERVAKDEKRKEKRLYGREELEAKKARI